MKSYTIRKVDTNLYIKGFSGPLVFMALYSLLGMLFLFMALYIMAGTFVAVAVCIPGFFFRMYQLNRIQKKYGPSGWHRKRVSRKLPEFIMIKKRICQL